MNRGTSKETSSPYGCVAFALASLAVLVITLVVFPTSLNPGLPLLLAGLLATTLATYRLAAGSGRYFRKESEIVTLLLAWLVVCSFFTLDEFLTRRSVATFVGGATFLFATQVGIQSRRHWRGMVYTLVGVCTLASIQAWIPALKAARISGTLSPLKGTFVNPDTFSILPLIALCLVLGLVESASTKGTIVNLFLAGFHLMTVFATGCRASMLGFFLGGALFVGSLLYFRKNKAEKTQLFVGFPLLLTFLAIPLIGYKFSFSSKWTRILETNAAEMEEIRFELLQHGWKAVLQNPLFGSGSGTFGLSYQTVRPPDHNFMYINIAHNDFLEMATETGLPGLVLWCALTWFAITIPLKYVPKGRRPTEAAAVAGAVVALTTYSMFNFIIVQRPVFWAQCWLLGLALAFPSSRLKTQEHNAVRFASSGFLLLMGAWAAWVGWQSLRADAFYVQAHQAERKLNLEEAKVFYEEAAKLEPPRVDGGLKHVEVLEKLYLFSGQDNLDERLAILENLRAASPHSIPLLIRLAEIQQSAGELEMAKATLQKARELTPYKQEVFEAQLVLLLSSGDLKGAADSLSQFSSTNWKQTHDQFEKVLFALTLEQPETATAVAEDWLKKNPSERGPEFVLATANRARASKEWEAEKTLLEVLTKAQPDNLCIRLQRAEVLGKLSGQEAVLADLDDAVKNVKEELDPCYDKLLQRWTALSLEAGKPNTVQEILENYLKVAPNQSWARAHVAELMADTGDSAKAAKLLRLGLERSPNDGQLVLALAHVFEKQGSYELALNYYREVVRLDPKNGEAKSKVKQLVKRR